MTHFLQEVKEASQTAFSRNLILKSIIPVLFLVFGNYVNAQVAPTAFTVIDQVPAKLDLTVNGYGGDSYPSANSYTVRFGRQSETVDGTNKKVSAFISGGLTYKPVSRPATTPFDNVILKRKANANVADLGKVTAFFQSVAPVTNPVPNGTTLYYPPEHVGTMEGLINSNIVNRGTDNVFANANGITLNNIERIDMILTNGMAATDVVKTGFLLMERGGNDPFKVAAITSLTSTGQIATLGTLISAPDPVQAWGNTGVSITTTVFQKNTGDANIRPDQNIPAQAISGSYISFQALGISAKTTIYGLALFPNDVTTAMDLVGLSNVPLNTDATSGQGGLDFTAGGGFFIEQNTSLAFSLSGNVYNDANGLTNSLIDGIGINNPGGSQLYAYLVGTDNLVKAKVLINADGSFEFVNELVGNTDYTIVISTTNVALGALKPSSAALPSGWVATGDGFGSSNAAGSGIQSGIPDLQIPVKAIDASITNVKFGIERLPESVSVNTTTPTPALNSTISVNALTGSDPEDQPTTGVLTGKTIQITALPTNSQLLYNGVPVVLNQLITNYTPALLQIKFTTATAESSTQFSFAYVDAAGFADRSPATYTVNWTSAGPLPISLLDFTATKQPKVVDLNWQTSNEQNSSHFDVEFSKDGSEFKSIGKVNAAGNSSTTKNYTLVHLSPVNGINYYRLKMIDVDGTFKYSKVLTVKFSSTISYKIMPNPTADRVYITSNEGGVLQSVGVYSIDGKLLQQVTNFNLGKSIDLSNYAPSIYILRLIDKDGTTEVIRVVKK